MVKIAVLSDTHGLLRPEVTQILRGCNAIVHGGDINRQSILDELSEIAPVYAVRGNNDKEWAEALPETLTFTLYGIRFFMVHNKKRIPEDTGDVDIIVYGHSHKYEEKYAEGKLFLNPGSCGPRRFTQPVTFAVLEVEADEEGGRRNGSEEKNAEEKTAEAAETEPGSGNETSCGIRTGRERLWRVKKIDIVQNRPAPADGTDESKEKMPENIRQIIRSVMKDTDKGRTVQETAERNGIGEELAEQICRLYLTHPGVDADGIMKKMGI